MSLKLAKGIAIVGGIAAIAVAGQDGGIYCREWMS
jgi:hypothetical protein